MSGELIVQEENRQPALPVISDSQQPMRLLELAINKDADIEKLERLMAMQTQWDERNAKREFLVAMARFQIQCPSVKKLKDGHNCKYAPLSDIVAQVRELIAECGMCYRFEQDHEKGIRVTCIVSHESGHSESNTMVAAPDTSGGKNAIQAIGSTVQYLMRYTFVGAFGITTADEDMDGRLPEKVEAAIDRGEVIKKIQELIKSKGNTDEQFLAWFSKAAKLPEPKQCFSVMSDKELVFALSKLEAKK
jgi:hypothetical protein